jgi:hypothetical protein
MQKLLKGIVLFLLILVMSASFVFADPGGDKDKTDGGPAPISCVAR